MDYILVFKALKYSLFILNPPIPPLIELTGDELRCAEEVEVKNKDAGKKV